MIRAFIGRQEYEDKCKELRLTDVPDYVFTRDFAEEPD